ncbi:MAG: pentapeptide repeat-containing protein [Pseudomonadota bacterium]
MQRPNDSLDTLRRNRASFKAASSSGAKAEANRDAEQLVRIDALTKNARTTWFTLLGVLLFVEITLLGVRDIDFYGYDRSTQLPLLGVSIPTRFYFWTAPALMAATFIYFHLYLIRLWAALGAAEATVNGGPLGRAVTPWLITDAALWLRNWRRSDGCTDVRPLEGLAALLNFSLIWAFGFWVGAHAWWLSATARDEWMTGVAAVALGAMVLAGLTSLLRLWQHLAKNEPRHRGTIAWLAAIALIPFLGASTYYRTVNPADWMSREGHRPVWNETKQAIEWRKVKFPFYADRETIFFERFFTLAEIDLEGEDLVERPDNWLPYSMLREGFRRDWCTRTGNKICADLSETDEQALHAEFWGRQKAALANLRRPDWHGPGRPKPDFRGANLRSTFLVGLDLSLTEMERADLARAEMQGAILSRARMQEADLSNAKMQWVNLKSAEMEWASLNRAAMQRAKLRGAKLRSADLRGAEMQGADLSGAELQRASLNRAELQGADLEGAELQHADLRRAKMQRANLSYARMRRVDLSDAELQKADLSEATMQRANLRKAKMHGVKLSLSYLTKDVKLTNASLSASINDGGALRDVELTDIKIESTLDWRNVFLDGSVKGADRLIAAMGLDTAPCHWALDEILSDAEFHGRWRGWLELSGSFPRLHSPGDPLNVSPIPPPEGCTWYTDPLPGMPERLE